MISPRVARSLEIISHLGHAWRGEITHVPFNTAHALLNHLVEAGLLTAEFGRLYRGARRKYYSLTPAGLAALRLYNDAQ